MDSQLTQWNPFSQHLNKHHVSFTVSDAFLEYLCMCFPVALKTGWAAHQDTLKPLSAIPCKALVICKCEWCGWQTTSYCLAPLPSNLMPYWAGLVLYINILGWMFSKLYVIEMWPLHSARAYQSIVLELFGRIWLTQRPHMMFLVASHGKDSLRFAGLRCGLPWKNAQ